MYHAWLLGNDLRHSSVKQIVFHKKKKKKGWEWRGQIHVTLACQLLGTFIAIQKQWYCISYFNVIPATTKLTTTGHICTGEALLMTHLGVRQHLLDEAVSVSWDAHQFFIELTKNHIKRAFNFDVNVYFNYSRWRKHTHFVGIWFCHPYI